MKRYALCSRCGHKIPLTYNGTHEFYSWNPHNDIYLCESCMGKVILE